MDWQSSQLRQLVRRAADRTRSPLLDCACDTFSYREAGQFLWRRCQGCGYEEPGRWIRTATIPREEDESCHPSESPSTPA